MSAREWRPGDPAKLLFLETGVEALAVRNAANDGWEHAGTFGGGSAYDHIGGFEARLQVVIDPDDREQSEQLAAAIRPCMRPDFCGQPVRYMGKRLQDAFRGFARREPAEPTDPRAHVTDRRDNIWRLLADGDWVCTSGPDIGEYIAWSRLAAERGPISVEVIE